MPVQTTIKVRRDTSANWASTNPVLASGEIGYDIDQNKVKYGNGTSDWNSLSYSQASYATSAGSANTATTATNTTNQWLLAKNSTGSTIAKGVPVYVSGANGTNILISKASNASEATSSKTLGLTYASMSNNATNYVVTEGLLSGVNTSSATLGDPVWLGVDGALIYGVANKPVAPAHMVSLGVVTKVNASTGEIFVKVQNGFELEELHDVLITNKADGDIIAYDEASGLWKNSAGGFAPTANPTFTTGSITTAYTAKSVYGGAFSGSALSIYSSTDLISFDYGDKLSFSGADGIDGIIFTVEAQFSTTELYVTFDPVYASAVDTWTQAHYDGASADTADWLKGEVKTIAPAELETLDGATSNLQAQINTKAAASKVLEKYGYGTVYLGVSSTIPSAGLGVKEILLPGGETQDSVPVGTRIRLQPVKPAVWYSDTWLNKFIEGTVTGWNTIQHKAIVNFDYQYQGNTTNYSWESGSRVFIVAPQQLAFATDVAITSPTNGQSLTYDSASSKWVNSAAAATGETISSFLLMGA